MLKRIVKATLSAVLALAMIGTMSGCSYWNGHSKGECKQLIADALEEKYGEEFVVDDIHVGAGGWYGVSGPLVATCYSKSNDSLFFETEYNVYGEKSYSLYDLYIQSIVEQQIKDIVDTVLSNYFDTFATDIYIYGLADCYDPEISPTEATVKTFSEATNKEGKKNLSTMWIILDESEIKNHDEMIQILCECAKDLHDMYIGFDVWYVPKNILTECVNLKSDDKNYSSDLEKLVGYKYLRHEYSFHGTTQTLEFYKEVDFQKLLEVSEEQ